MNQSLDKVAPLGQSLFENPIWRELAAQGLSQLVRATSGSAPEIVRTSDYTEIKLSAEQKTAAQNYLTNMLDKKPGPLRMDAGGVILPVVLKKYGPWLAGLGVGALIVGVLVGRAVSR